MNLIDEIEEAFVAQWSHFGRWPSGKLHERGGLVWTETPMRSLPYNGVIRTRLDEASAEAAIDDVIGRYRERGVNFMWIAHPTASPGDLGKRLESRGLTLVEVATCMSLELDGWTGPSPTAEVREVQNDDDLERYAEIIMKYWEVPADDQPHVREMNRYWSGERAPGARFLAFLEDGEPVGKGYLSLAGPPGVAAIFGMSVVPTARGKGVASAMTAAMLNRACDEGCRRVVLHSSEMAVSLYRRAGFMERCRFEVYATGPLWSHKA